MTIVIPLWAIWVIIALQLVSLTLDIALFKTQRDVNQLKASKTKSITGSTEVETGRLDTVSR